jgi:hypothetical protein
MGLQEYTDGLLHDLIKQASPETAGIKCEVIWDGQV